MLRNVVLSRRRLPTLFAGLLVVAACSSSPDAGTQPDLAAFLDTADEVFRADIVLTDASASEDARCYLSETEDGQLNPWIRCGPAAIWYDDSPWFAYPTEVVRSDKFDAESPLAREISGSYSSDTVVDGMELLFRPDGQKPESEEWLFHGFEPLDRTSGQTQVVIEILDECSDTGRDCVSAGEVSLTEDLGVCLQEAVYPRWMAWLHDPPDEITLHDPLNDITATPVKAIETQLRSNGVIVEYSFVSKATTFGHHLPSGVAAFAVDSVNFTESVEKALIESVERTPTGAAFVGISDNWIMVEAANEEEAMNALVDYLVDADMYTDLETHTKLVTLSSCPNP